MKVICSHYDRCDTPACGHKSEHNHKWSCNHTCTTRHKESRCIKVGVKIIIDVDKLFEEIDI